MSPFLRCASSVEPSDSESSLLASRPRRVSLDFGSGRHDVGKWLQMPSREKGVWHVAPSAPAQLLAAALAPDAQARAGPATAATPESSACKGLEAGWTAFAVTSCCARDKTWANSVMLLPTSPTTHSCHASAKICRASSALSGRSGSHLTRMMPFCRCASYSRRASSQRSSAHASVARRNARSASGWGLAAGWTFAAVSMYARQSWPRSAERATLRTA
mmetsp:Transcript_51046/g.160163  ORF Transcript_51046/g.160163 Transcript_51046/m.160163 type:complete len:218 (-) Transcript_51046:131-784(-)